MQQSNMQKRTSVTEIYLLGRHNRGNTKAHHAPTNLEIEIADGILKRFVESGEPFWCQNEVVSGYDRVGEGFIEPEVGTSHTVDIVEQGIESTVSRFMVKGEMMDIKYKTSPPAEFVSCLVYLSIKQRCDPDRTRGNTNAVRSDKYPNHTLEVPRYENFQRDMLSKSRAEEDSDK